MKLPYHRMHEHYLPDAMHTIKEVVSNAIYWLIGQETLEKLLGGEMDGNVVKEDLRTPKVSLLTPVEKTLGNKRCRLLEFPKMCARDKGDIFAKPDVTLKDTHGYTEVIINSFSSVIVN